MKILISIGASVFMLLLLEAAVRLYGWAPLPQSYEGKRDLMIPPYGRIECMNPQVTRPYFNQPGNIHMGCVYYSINNLGFRNVQTVPTEKMKGFQRVAVVGDSFTFGFGVLEDDTFEKQLETKWRASNKFVEVLNAAHPGAGLKEYDEILKTKVAPLNPDAIIVGINLNDVMTFNSAMLVENISRHFDWEIRKVSKLIDFFCDTFERRLSSRENINSILRSFTHERLNQFHQFVKSMKSVAAEKNARLFVIIHPVFFDLDNYHFQNVHKQLGEVLKQENVSYHDFLEDFIGKNAEDFWITKNDQHPNEKAHQIYTEYLFNHLKI